MYRLVIAEAQLILWRLNGYLMKKASDLSLSNTHNFCLNYFVVIILINYSAFSVAREVKIIAFYPPPTHTHTHTSWMYLYVLVFEFSKMGSLCKTNLKCCNNTALVISSISNFLVLVVYVAFLCLLVITFIYTRYLLVSTVWTLVSGHFQWSCFVSVLHSVHIWFHTDTSLISVILQERKSVMCSVLQIKLIVNSRILTPFGRNASERKVQ